jgi:hypothetical protein
LTEGEGTADEGTADDKESGSGIGSGAFC